MTRHHSRRVSPFGHPRIHARLTAPRGISQPPTSFIGFQCQGIHHAPLNTYKHKTKSLLKLSKLHINTNGEPLLLDARNHYPQIKHHTPPPKMERQPIPYPRFPIRDEEIGGLVASKPNSVSDYSITGKSSPGAESRSGSTFVVHQNHTHYRCGPSSRIAQVTEPPHMWAGHGSRGAP